jgi:methyl-accepting chemotaxis protein
VPQKENGVNFDEAITAHSAWKTKLSAYLAKPDHSLKVTDVAADDKCKLGQWIKGEGHKHSSLPEFSKLVTEHTRFHKAAGEVIRKADSGQKVTDEVALGAKSEFSSASSSVVSAIMYLKAKA